MIAGVMRFIRGSLFPLSRKIPHLRLRRKTSALCQLPTANCLLPTAYCLLLTAYCQLPTSGGILGKGPLSSLYICGPPRRLGQVKCSPSELIYPLLRHTSMNINTTIPIIRRTLCCMPNRGMSIRLAMMDPKQPPSRSAK